MGRLMNEQPASGIADQTKVAFEHVRRGDLGPVSSLQTSGAAVIPFVAPYLQDTFEDVRREAVSLLGVIGTKAALPLLARALEDRSADIQDRAASALYERFTPDELAGNAAIGDALRAAVGRGNTAASARLLLVNYPGPETESVLRADAERTPPVPHETFRIFRFGAGQLAGPGRSVAAWRWAFARGTSANDQRRFT